MTRRWRSLRRACRRRSAAAPLLLIAATAFLGVTIATADAAPTRAQVYLDDSITSGCVIRFYEDSAIGGPEIHENASHTCDLATSISVTSTGRLRLIGVSSLPIKTIMTTPDECLVDLKVAAGPSGGSGDIEIQMTIDGTPVWATNNVLSNNGSRSCNLWVGAVHDLPVP